MDGFLEIPITKYFSQSKEYIPQIHVKFKEYKKQ